jgi:hypothetical protein
MVAIGLQKPYAKTEVGESCTCIDVYVSRFPVEVTSLQDQNSLNTFRDQNTALQLHSNRTIIQQYCLRIESELKQSI